MPAPSLSQEGACAPFERIQMPGSDVTVCSLAGGGGRIMNRILQLLLHGIDDAGHGLPVESAPAANIWGREPLPAELARAGGSGRLVIVLRNLKDVLTALHFSGGEPKDGWLGNEHGPGSLARFICPNAYGSAFEWSVDAHCAAPAFFARAHTKPARPQ